MVAAKIKKVLVIGSGPIVIGQAAEFDYAGTQACKALREEGIYTILVNSNPATIMTDEGVADVTYIEPLSVEFLRKIIDRERPDGLLATLGGQTGLNMAVSLQKAGVLDEFGVRLLGTPLESIQQAEDRELFKQLLIKINEPVPPSKSVNTTEEAQAFAKEIGFPLVIRPAFTLGGTGGGIATNTEELDTVVARGLSASPIHQVLVEKYLAGWKEVEYEVIRDANDTCITICNMENIDPMGVHTGDSIVVAPSQTLSDKEYQMLRSASIKIIRSLGIEGGCNVQLALDPKSFQYYVIEVNPRVSRSSALASKATGFPIARVAAKIAIGRKLEEIPNAVTGKTCAAFEPSLDYVVVKIPRWPFDKFPQANRNLGTQMKATGEVMAIDRTFEAALQKAVRALEFGGNSLLWEPAEDDVPAQRAIQPMLHGMETPSENGSMPKPQTVYVGGILGTEAGTKIILPEKGDYPANDIRIWRLMAALRKDHSSSMINILHQETGIDIFFLIKMQKLVEMEERLRSEELSRQLLHSAKRLGFSDKQIASLTNRTSEDIRQERIQLGIRPVFKMVDTCAAEFAAQTAYFYSTYAQENEALPVHEKGAVVLGSGPIRIGQGIEFDYCSVRSAAALHLSGYKSIMINSNPETVSTDFDMSDRLYFEPLDEESVRDIIDNENSDSGPSNLPVIVQFGGQTAINLAGPLAQRDIPVLGTSIDSIDLAEDRRRFDALLEDLRIPRPKGAAITSLDEAVKTANEIGYPVLVRPSYVLGGRAMEIIYEEGNLRRYITNALSLYGDKPILVDRYLSGKEVEVDIIADGQDVLIPGIMEHIERAGVHSGDSSAVYPPVTLTENEINVIIEYSRNIALAMGVRGLLNAQYVVTEDGVFVLEVNPRASRTVPFLSKVTGVPMVTLATQIMLGSTLPQLGYQGGLWPVQPLVAVKAPVFSMSKLTGAEAALGPEMKSTGEVMGIDFSYPAAVSKAFIAAGMLIPSHDGKAFVSIADRDKNEAKAILQMLGNLGYSYYATAGTAQMLKEMGLEATTVGRISEGDQTILNLIRGKKVDLVINTISGRTHLSAGGKILQDGFDIRRTAVEAQIPCLTSLDTTRAIIDTMGKEGLQYEVLPFVEYRVSPIKETISTRK